MHPSGAAFAGEREAEIARGVFGHEVDDFRGDQLGGADEIAFLVDGRLILRSSKEDLLDGWGRIGFQSSQAPESVPEAFSLRSDGSRHQVLSRDTKTSARWLAQAGATHVEVARMTLDEIAVELIKQGEQSWPA